MMDRNLSESQRCRCNLPKDDMKKILDSLLKTNFTKVRDKNTFLMGIVRRVRKEATEKNE